MDNKESIRLKKKQTMFSVLRAIAYCGGFPLLLLLVLLGSTQFRHSQPFVDTWYLGIVICAIPWILTAILQVGFGYSVKGQNLKTIVVVAITIVIMLTSAGVIDIYGKSVIEKTQTTYSEGKYADQDIVVEPFNKQINWYITLTNETSYTSKFVSEYSRFVRVYNINTTGGKGWSRASVNFDGSPATPGTEKWLGLKGVYVSPNGMLSDGWIFSVQNAIDIISTYYEIYNKAKANGIDLEAEYDNIITQVKNGDPYQDYQNTDEYKAAYGDEGSAYDYMITEDKLNQMIPVVAKYLALAVEDLYGTGLEVAIKAIINPEDIKAIKDIDDLLAFANNMIPTVAGFMGTENNPLLDSTSETGYLKLTKPMVLDLLAQFSYYVSPQAKPVFAFIAETIPDYVDAEDNVIVTAEEVQKFAFARYYGKVQGANIGSILIPTESVDATSKSTYSNIGQVTMSDSGYPASFAFTLPEIYKLECDLSYMPQLYPLFAARRYLYVFAGICALCMILFYQFLRREEEIRDELIVYGGTQK